jgi:hypothetical protein
LPPFVAPVCSAAEPLTTASGCADTLPTTVMYECFANGELRIRVVIEVLWFAEISCLRVFLKIGCGHPWGHDQGCSSSEGGGARGRETEGVTAPDRLHTP